MTVPYKSLLALVAFSLLSSDALARSIRLDDTLNEFQFTGGLAPPVNVLSGNGSSSAVAIQSYNLDSNGFPDFADPRAFSVNIFGTTYSSFYVNENGNMSFGGGFGGRPGNSDPANAGVPVFAPFFADVDSDLSPIGGSISHGFFPELNGIAISWSGVGFSGQDSANDPRRVSMQVVIIDISDVTGNPGDFKLEMNFQGGGMEWETGDTDGGLNGLGGVSALAGFWDGMGMGYQLPGSGVNGALLGTECDVPPVALYCNDYDFEFRNGIPYFLDGSPVFAVPEPPVLALIAAGFVMIAWSRRRRT